MKRVGFVLKRDLKPAERLADDLIALLLARGDATVIVPHASAHAGRPGVATADTARIGAEADLIVSLGGDGTLIHAVNASGDRDVPVLGVNMGTLGFLTEIAVESAPEALNRALDGTADVSHRRMLTAELVRDGAVVHAGTVLNDVVVNKMTLARILTLEVEVYAGYVNTYRGDGLIVSTPTGSTAYALAAGGPVVHPSIPAIQLTPICSFGFADRTLLLPDDAEVTIECRSAGGGAYLTLDGQTGHEVRENDRVYVRRAAREARLVMSPDAGYFDVLRRKLRWGRERA